MNDLSPPNDNEPSNGQDIWDALVSEDDTELDLEMLAAYAEGRLGERDREEVRRLVSRSPKAMELLDAIWDHAVSAEQEEDVFLAAAVAAAEATIDAAKDSRQESVAPSRKTPVLVLSVVATAASILVFSAGYVAYDSWQKNNQFGRELALARKEQVILLSGSRPLMVGETSAAVARRALYDGPISRGESDLTDEEREEIRLSAEDARAVIEKAISPGMQLEIESAAIELSIGDIDAAKTRVLAALQQYGESALLRNTLAAVYASEAEELALVEAKAALEKAEDILQQLLADSPGFASAWFNLALVKERLARKEPEIRATWQNYLKHEPREDLRKYVRDARDVAD